MGNEGNKIDENSYIEDDQKSQNLLDFIEKRNRKKEFNEPMDEIPFTKILNKYEDKSKEDNEKKILHDIDNLPESKYIDLIKELTLKKNKKNSVKINYLNPISNLEINNKKIKNINDGQEENKEEFTIKQGKNIPKEEKS